jgi:uncharacterized protein (TIGR02265 family)
VSEVVFKNTLAGMLELLGPEVRTPALEARLAELGLPLAAPPAQLDRAKWNELIRVCAAAVNPGDSEDEANFKLGRGVIDRMRGSFAGKAQAAMAQLLGPKRMLELFRTMLASGNNYSQVRVVKGDEQSAEFWINETGVQQPSFVAGLLAACVEIAGGKDARVTLRKVSAAEGATYDVVWR